MTYRLHFGLLWLCSLTGFAQSLHQSFEQAWQQQSAARLQPLYQQLSAQQAHNAQRLLADSPSLSLQHQRTDLEQENARRSVEARLDLPLWLPGQQQSLQALADATEQSLPYQQEFERWQLAGLLREHYWQYRLAQQQVEQLAQQRQAQDAQWQQAGLELSAGQIANTQRLQLNLQRQQLHSEQLEARLSLEQAELQFRQTSLGAPLPDAAEEMPATTAFSLQQHPQWRYLQAELTRQQAQYQAAQQSLSANPELQLGLGRERERFATEPEFSLTLGLKLPLGKAPGRQLQLRQQDLQRRQAELALEQAQYLLPQQYQQARQAYQLAQQQLVIQQQRQHDSQQLLNASQQAFKLGQIDWLNLQQATQQQQAATAAVQTAQLQRAYRIALLNQASGLLP